MIERLRRRYDSITIKRRNRREGESLEELEGIFEIRIKEGVEVKSGRRTILIWIIEDLEGNKTEEFMREIRERVITSYYMRYVY